MVLACLTLLGPAAAKRQPSEAPATRDKCWRETSVGSGGSNSRSMSQVSKEAWSGTEESPGGVQSVFEV